MHHLALLTALLIALHLPVCAQQPVTASVQRTVIIQFEDRTSAKTFAEIREKIRNNPDLTISSSCLKRNIICFRTASDKTNVLEDLLHEMQLGYEVKKGCDEQRILSCDEGENR